MKLSGQAFLLALLAVVPEVQGAAIIVDGDAVSARDDLASTYTPPLPIVGSVCAWNHQCFNVIEDGCMQFNKGLDKAARLIRVEGRTVCKLFRNTTTCDVKELIEIKNPSPDTIEYPSKERDDPPDLPLPIGAIKCSRNFSSVPPGTEEVQVIVDENGLSARNEPANVSSLGDSNRHVADVCWADGKCYPVIEATCMWINKGLDLTVWEVRIQPHIYCKFYYEPNCPPTQNPKVVFNTMDQPTTYPSRPGQVLPLPLGSIVCFAFDPSKPIPPANSNENGDGLIVIQGDYGITPEIVSTGPLIPDEVEIKTALAVRDAPTDNNRDADSESLGDFEPHAADLCTWDDQCFGIPELYCRWLANGLDRAVRKFIIQPYHLCKLYRGNICEVARRVITIYNHNDKPGVYPSLPHQDPLPLPIGSVGCFLFDPKRVPPPANENDGGIIVLEGGDDVETPDFVGFGPLVPDNVDIKPAALTVRAAQDPEYLALFCPKDDFDAENDCDRFKGLDLCLVLNSRVGSTWNSVKVHDGYECEMYNDWKCEKLAFVWVGEHKMDPAHGSIHSIKCRTKDTSSPPQKRDVPPKEDEIPLWTDPWPQGPVGVRDPEAKVFKACVGENWENMCQWFPARPHVCQSPGPKTKWQGAYFQITTTALVTQGYACIIYQGEHCEVGTEAMWVGYRPEERRRAAFRFESSEDHDPKYGNSTTFMCFDLGADFGKDWPPYNENKPPIQPWVRNGTTSEIDG